MQNETISKELNVGELLNNGSYVIEGVAGAGGFGITYKARHTTLNTIVAIKEFFINGYCMRGTGGRTIALQNISEDVYEKYRQKFVEEAKTLAQLSHSNIIQVSDVFNENGTSYFVMPYVNGSTIQRLIEQKGALMYDEAVNYIGQLTEAIGYLHKQKILHRDIKPDNIIITPENRIVLIDFGSAREFVHDKTQSHTAILTKGYAPLEQYSSTSRKGNYTDIYALGAVFYFALTGKKPMDATERTLEKMAEPKALNSSIPTQANNTIIKAMEMIPANRYQTVEEFRMDLLKMVKEGGLGKEWFAKIFGLCLLMWSLPCLYFTAVMGVYDLIIKPITENQPFVSDFYSELVVAGLIGISGVLCFSFGYNYIKNGFNE